MPLSLLEQEPCPLYVAGKARTTKETFDLVDPHDANGKVLFKVCAASEADVDAAVDAAWAAFPSWSQSDYETRRNICLKAAALVRERTAELVAVDTAETVSAPAWANFTIGALVPEGLEETAAAISHLRGEIAPAKAGFTAYIDRVPFGVVLGCAPWNAPLTLGVRAVRDAIMAGNTAILKASEYSPRIHLAIAQIFQDAGLPAGVLNVLHIATKDAPKLVERIIARREVGKVNFTGSTVVGAKIAEVCGRHLKPSVMELGGKAPLIVLPSADVNLAAHGAMFAGLHHSGQICMSTDVLLVHETVAEPFAAALKKEWAHLKASKTDPWLRGLFNTGSAKRVNGFVDDALKKGAKVLAGTREGNEHNIVQPLALEGITDDMRMFPGMLLAHQESFGPLVSMRTFKTDQECIRLANMSDFGLSSAVYAQDLAHAMRIAKQIVSGAVHINSMSIHDEGPLPHGGCKASGWGRFNSVEGLKEFTFSRVITTVDEPFRYT